MRQADLEALGAVTPLLATLKAWRVFKASHNVKDAKLACCEKTVALFDSLDALEKEIIEPAVKGKLPLP